MIDINSSPMRPNYKSTLEVDSVAVIVLSHNYGCYLQQCLDSLLNQTKVPFECVVVADSCSPDDTTVQIAEQYGLRCLAVDHSNTHMSRATGFEYTRSPLVMFLDADDWLDPDYIEIASALLINNKDLGIVGSHMARNHESVYYKQGDINQQNWLHSGSMTRRTCIIGSEAFDYHVRQQSHADWFLWRRIINDGWDSFVMPEPLYNYRVHDTQQTKSLQHLKYYDLAALETESITVVIPLCRDRYWPRLFDWLIRNVLHYDKVLLIDSSIIPTQVRSDLSKLGKDINHIRRVPNGGLADADRQANQLKYLEVQETMLKVYKPLQHVTTEYMFIIEDDVVPPDGAITTLLMNMDHDVAAVSGVVRSRFDTDHRVIAGNSFESVGEIVTQVNKVDEVSYTGFGCLLLRKSALKDARPFQTGNYDMIFCRELQQCGYKWLLDWSVDCIHGDLTRDK